MYMNTQTINLSLPVELLQVADRTAKREFKNRSELLREALLYYIRKADKYNSLYQYWEKQAQKKGVKNEADIDKIVYEFRHGK